MNEEIETAEYGFADPTDEGGWNYLRTVLLYSKNQDIGVLELNDYFPNVNWGGVQLEPDSEEDEIYPRNPLEELIEGSAEDQEYQIGHNDFMDFVHKRPGLDSL